MIIQDKKPQINNKPNEKNLKRNLWGLGFFFSPVVCSASNTLKLILNFMLVLCAGHNFHILTLSLEL